MKTITFKSHFIINPGVAALLCACSTAALAQQAPAGVRTVAADTPPATQGLGDIVVTAERRSESSQKVGIAVASLTGSELVAKGVSDVEDIASHVPNVNVNFGLGISSFNIRGIGLSSFAANLDAPVAIHVDEVYQSKPFMTGLLLFDVNRVEVASGPQGTLFGRNATGGTVNITTEKPKDYFEIGDIASYGNYKTFRDEGYINLPVANNLAVRVSGFGVHQTDGYYYNRTLNVTEGYDRNYALRGQIKWTSAATTVLGSFHYGREQGTEFPYEATGIYTPQSYALLNPTGGFANVGLLTYCANYLNGTVNGADKSCVRGNDGKIPGEANPYTSTGHHVYPINDTSIGGMVRVDQDLGFADLASITDYEKFTRDQSEVGDDSPTYDGTWLFWYSQVRQFTQEVRLTSQGNDKWNYVIGGFYEHDDLATRDYLTYGHDTTPATGGFFTDTNQKSDAFAIYTNHKIAVVDTLKLIAGLRYNHERYNINGGTCFGSGITGYPIQRPTSACVPLSQASELPGGSVNADSNASFKVGTEWTPRIDWDALNSLLVYANVSTAYRSGGYNSDLATDQASFTKLSPEEITAYEGGFKSMWAHNTLRLNATVFHYDFKNGIIRIDTDALVPITVNAASITTTGAELNTAWQPVGGLQFGVSLGWLDSKFGGNLTSSGVSLAGKTPVNSPKYTFNGDASYKFAIAGGYHVNTDINANWRSRQYLEPSNLPVIAQAPYWLMNGSIGFGPDNGPWTVAVWAKNITNTAYKTYTNNVYNFGWTVAIYNQPRTYGASLSVHFK